MAVARKKEVKKRKETFHVTASSVLFAAGRPERIKAQKRDKALITVLSV